MKIYSKKIVAIFSGIAISTVLSGCMPASQNKHSSEPSKVIEEVRKETNKEEKNFTKEYLDGLNQEFKELEEYAKEKWDSDECVEKRKQIKSKLKTLSDFIFNGKKINGITFDELKEEEKEKLLNELDALDSKIDEYIPDYKERFKNWTVEKGADAKSWLVEKGADLKEVWNNYKNEVEEEYNSRKSAKKK